MPDFISLTCPKCGGKMKLTQDIQQFACVNCGTEYWINKGDGFVSLEPLLERLDRLQVSIDRSNVAQTSRRLQTEIETLKLRKQALDPRQTPNESVFLYFAGCVFIIAGILSVVIGNVLHLAGGEIVFLIFLILSGVVSYQAYQRKEQEEKINITQTSLYDQVRVEIFQKQNELEDLNNKNDV